MTILQILFWALFAIGLSLIIRRICIGDYPDTESESQPQRFSDAVIQSIQRTNRGKSAYETALSLGFVGNEQEWLKTMCAIMPIANTELEDPIKAKARARWHRRVARAEERFKNLRPTLCLNNSLDWSDDIYGLMVNFTDKAVNEEDRSRIRNILVDGHRAHQEGIQHIFQH